MKSIATEKGQISDGVTSPVHKQRKRSVITLNSKDIEVDATPEELATMKEIFNSFDVEKHGYITADEISSLHRTLGEPLTEEEAKENFDAMDEEKCGKGSKIIKFIFTILHIYPYLYYPYIIIFLYIHTRIYITGINVNMAVIYINNNLF